MASVIYVLFIQAERAVLNQWNFFLLNARDERNIESSPARREKEKKDVRNSHCDKNE